MKSWKRHSNKRAVDGDASTSKAEDSFFGNKIKETRKQLKSTLFGSRAPRSRGTTLEDTSVFVTHSGEEPECKSIKDAVRFGKPDELRKRINADNVDKPVTDGLRVSDLAAALGNIQFLQVVIDNNAQINTKNSANQLPIHYALTSPDPAATVAFLLECGAVTDIPFPNGDFLMHKACSESSTALLELLLSHDSSLDCVDHMKLTPLHRASINDLKDHCEIIIQAAPHLVNEQDRDGRTPLHIAVSNQSIQLMKILLDRGAAIDKETIEGLTPIDLMMASKNRGALRELIFYFTDKVSKDVKAYKVQELYRSKHFHKFLSLLQLIDSDTHKCYYRSPDEKLESAEEQKLIDELLDLDEERLQDVIEFQSKVMAALRTNAIHEQTDNREVIDTIAIFTTKYILFREDVALLQEVMRCGVVWQKVRSFLEQHISTLYTKTNKESSLISKLFASRFIEISSNGKRVHFKRTALEEKIGNVLGLHNLGKDSEHRLEVQNPIDTLLIWSILTGKLNLTLEFLSKYKFETVPLCLMAAGLLRNLHKVLDVQSIEVPAIAVLADQCELFACKIIDRTAAVDISSKKRVTYQHLLQRMPAFNGLNCIHLAANCSCDTFMRMDMSQKAMDTAWYRFLLELNPIYREVIIQLGAIPFNPIVALALYHDYVKSKHRGHQRRGVSDKTDSPTSQRNSRTSFVIGEDDMETATMFSEDLDSASQVADGSGSFCNRIVECWYLYYYFYQIPAVKFRYFTISHLILLATFSYVVQFGLHGNATALEVFVYITAFGFLVEEIKKLIISIWKQKVADYAQNRWHTLNCITCLMFLIGFILRLIIIEIEPHSFKRKMEGLFNDKLCYSARLSLSMSCLLFWMKLLNLSRVHEYFGPKLKMIYNMIIHDLIPFLYILVIFLFGFGILMCSLLYPSGYFAYNSSALTYIDIVKHMMQICFFSIFGEYHLDQVNGQEAGCEEVYELKLNNSLPCPNPQSTLLVPYILLPIYVTITTILLLSLIVALFSKTIEEIDSNSTALWQFERFQFITEYENFSSLPPPINVLDMTRIALLAVFHRYLPQPHKPVEMDFFNQDVTLRNLINQAIALRNSRPELLMACNNLKEAKASAVGIMRSASIFRR